MSEHTLIELPMRAGDLLRELEAIRAEQPELFERLPVYMSMLDDGGIAAESAQLAADPDGVAVSSMAARGSAYRIQLRYAPSIDRWFVVVEGEDDDAFGDQPDHD